MKLISFLKKYNIIKNNKGIAIEMVILATLIAFSLCSLMVVYAIKAKNMGYFSSNVTEERLQLDKIGDDYLNHLNKKSPFDVDNYYYEINNIKYYYRIEFENQFVDENKFIKVYDRRELLLRVDFDYDETLEKYIVIGWVYGE